jgi:hypothetical protein
LVRAIARLGGFIAFRRAAADQQRAGVTIRVQRLLASVPEVRAAWAAENAVLVSGGDVITRSDAFAAPATEDDVCAVDDLLQPQTVTRWTDMLPPCHVQSGQRFAVVVGLTCQEGEGELAKPISFLPGQTVRVVSRMSILRTPRLFGALGCRKGFLGAQCDHPKQIVN